MRALAGRSPGGGAGCGPRPLRVWLCKDRQCREKPSRSQQPLPPRSTSTGGASRSERRPASLPTMALGGPALLSRQHTVTTDEDTGGTPGEAVLATSAFGDPLVPPAARSPPCAPAPAAPLAPLWFAAPVPRSRRRRAAGPRRRQLSKCCLLLAACNSQPLQQVQLAARPRQRRRPRLQGRRTQSRRVASPTPACTASRTRTTSLSR